MGMQMPIFAAATQQVKELRADTHVTQHMLRVSFLLAHDNLIPDFPSLQATTNDDVDLHDIFVDYFNEDNGAASNADILSSALAQQQQLAQAQQAQLVSNAQQQLAANVALAQQQAQAQAQQQAQAQAQAQAQPVQLPTGSGIKTAWHSGALPVMQQQADNHSNQLPPAKRSKGEDLFLPGEQQPVVQNTLGGIGVNGILTQQHQLAMAASGVGTLSNRLGFVLPNSNNLTMAAQQQQHQPAISLPAQQANLQQLSAPASGGITLPIGVGIKFSPGGNIIPTAAASIQGGGGLVNGVMQNGTGANMAQGVVGVANTQYGISPQLQILDKGKVEDQMAAERRLRNREHAKRSRVRKKFMLESLQQQVRGLQDENSTLRMLVQRHIPSEALKIIDDCCSKSVLFGTGEGGPDGSTSGGGGAEDKDGKAKAKETPLLRSDFSLIESLTSGQQNFVLSDPRLPDNPIVFASPGFYELTGYAREQVLGRNCRFLQGAGTDRKAIEVIRTAVASGTDATVLLLNYKADGTPFWNQLFVAALRDADNCIVNYVSPMRIKRLEIYLPTYQELLPLTPSDYLSQPFGVVFRLAYKQ